MRLRHRLAGLGFTLAAASLASLGAVHAQGAAPAAAPAAPAAASVRLAGTITAATPGKFTLQSEAGTTTVVVPDSARISGVAPGSLADLKPGAYIGAGARPQPDGTLRAVQVYVFPEAQRGLAEGHKAWDVLPDSTMTNATVAETVGSVDGGMVSLTYKGGEKKLKIAPDSAILVFAPAGAADLVTGTSIAVSGAQGADGTLTATRITIGTKGTKPL